MPYDHHWRKITRPRILRRAGGHVDPIWKGDVAIELVYRGGAKCQKCGAPDYPRFLERKHRSRLDVAHLDGNTANDATENLAALCRTCHRAHDLAEWSRKYRQWVISEREKRLDRKDAERPILRMEAGQ